MWTCPKCATKVDDNFDVCWNCGTNADGAQDPDFVRADDAPPIEDRAYDPIAEPSSRLGTSVEGVAGEVVQAYQAVSLPEAKFIADQLAGMGIAAMSDTQDLQDALGVMDGNPRVYVRAIDLPRARVWLEAYDMRKKSEIEKHLDAD